MIRSLKQRVSVLLVGYGYWGPNLLRNLIRSGLYDVKGVIDSRADAREKCLAIYPHVPTFKSLDAAFSAGKSDAVVIATPPKTHSEFALQCLKLGIHVLLEKPMAVSLAQCDEILKSAAQHKAKVMVDHTFVYHPAIRHLANQIKKGDLGTLLYYDSVRVNFGGFQANTNVLWDLAPHDLSILDLFLDGQMPQSVSALANTSQPNQEEHLCYLTLKYADGVIGHLHLNWLAPTKIRTILLGGSKKMAVYDENLPSEKLKIYDKRLIPTLDARQAYRFGDMLAPALPETEALSTMLQAFYESIVHHTKPPSGGESGRRIVRILEAATESLASGGTVVDIPEETTLPARKKHKDAA